MCKCVCVYVCIREKERETVCDTGGVLRVLFDSLICKYVFIRFLIMYYTIM